MSRLASSAIAPPGKFTDPERTADGAPRAQVALTKLETLWVNTGSLCNLACGSCYIESSPSNDRLSYMTLEDLVPYLDEIDAEGLGPIEIGFTGGEPFLNPHMGALAEAALARGHRALILTNAMRPMRRPAVADALSALARRYGPRLALRVSLDSAAAAIHDAERGEGAFASAMEGLVWLARRGMSVSVAGRLAFAESEEDARARFAALFAEHAIALDASCASDLVLFPEMDADRDAPEITEACWDAVGVAPSSLMCASARMVQKRKGDTAPVVVPCTLLPYDRAFELGRTLKDADRPVSLNHPFCAQFCVLGGARCSG